MIAPSRSSVFATPLRIGWSHVSWWPHERTDDWRVWLGRQVYATISVTIPSEGEWWQDNWSELSDSDWY